MTTQRAIRRAWVFGAAAAFLAAAALCIAPVRDCLVIRSGAGRTAAVFPLATAEPAFRITFRHSVSREPWVESYRVAAGGTIELYRVAYKAFGAGSPTDDEGGTVSLRDGWIVIDGMKRDFPRITAMVLPLTEHRLSVDGIDYDLVGLLHGGSKAVLEIEKRPAAAVAMALMRNRELPRWVGPQ